MKKQYLWLLSAVIILIAAVTYYLFSTQTSNNIISEEQEEQNTQLENISTTISTQTESAENVSNQTGGSGSSENLVSKGGGGEVQKVNYTLSIDSFPEELEVLTNYSVNDVNLIIRDNVPYSVEIESGTTACILLTSPVKSGSVVKWELDGEECAPYLCSGFIGCSMFMDGPHTAVVYYSTPG